MRMRRMLACLLVATASLGLVAANTITATLTASPATYTGKCPTMVTFKGTISVTEPCKVQYKFLRSDVTDPLIDHGVKTLDFATPGSQVVSDTWTRMSTGVGWEILQVTQPRQVASSQAVFRVYCNEAGVQASLTASPTDFVGKCPVVIKFDGKISVTAPCIVNYRFIRSDNATPAHDGSVAFSQAGTKSVSDIWPLGGAAMPTYAGWEAIEILSPVPLQSNKAAFKITCTEGKPEVSATLTASPADYVGKCPAVIRFNGQISVTAPCTVQYKFLRSDNAPAPVQTMVFTKAGTNPVGSAWTLGGAAMPTYAGWGAIEILNPVPLQSNKATFKITCTDARK